MKIAILLFASMLIASADYHVTAWTPDGKVEWVHVHRVANLYGGIEFNGPDGKEIDLIDIPVKVTQE